MIVAVDLAAKFSALCVLDVNNDVIDQNHSWQKSESEWIDQVVSYFYQSNPLPTVLAIEDLPHGVGYKKLVKEVCRIQGRIYQLMSSVGEEDKVIFIPPQLWQIHHKTYRKGIVGEAEKASELGYSPPSLLSKDTHGKDRIAARKTETDYVAAYLIGRYVNDKLNEKSLNQWLEDEKRVQRYGQ